MMTKQNIPQTITALGALRKEFTHVYYNLIEALPKYPPPFCTTKTLSYLYKFDMVRQDVVQNEIAEITKIHVTERRKMKKVHTTQVCKLQKKQTKCIEDIKFAIPKPQ